MRDGRVRRAYLGVVVVPAPVAPVWRPKLGGRVTGLRVASVVSGGPADRAGLRSGDLLLTAGGHEVATAQDLQRLMFEEAIGRPLPGHRDAQRRPGRRHRAAGRDWSPPSPGRLAAGDGRTRVRAPGGPRARPAGRGRTRGYPAGSARKRAASRRLASRMKVRRGVGRVGRGGAVPGAVLGVAVPGPGDDRLLRIQAEEVAQRLAVAVPQFLPGHRPAQRSAR